MKKLNHQEAASRLDDLFTLAASIDLALSLAGCPSWGPDTPRAHSLAVLQHLGELRRALDASAVAAGFASPFVRRDLLAGPALAAAARAADLAQLEAEERELEARRHRTWRGNHLLPIAGPSGANSATRDDDHPGSLLTDPAKGCSSAAARAGDANGPEPHPSRPASADAT